MPIYGGSKQAKEIGPTAGWVWCPQCGVVGQGVIYSTNVKAHVHFNPVAKRNKVSLVVG